MSTARDESRRQCPSCLRPLVACYCGQLQAITNRWPVCIFQHPRESGHALGTARIAHLGLSDCDLRVLDGPVGPRPDDILIYPDATSRPLADRAGSVPGRLLFIDASWRKSRRVLHEQQALAELPRYHLEPDAPSRYRIRREPAPGFLSTLEAVVLALETVERAPGRYRPLLGVMDWMVDQQIRHMGEAVYRRHYGAPEADGS
ncbi:MAG: tRNA-uridine aminocarboxypropyltransferase [Pseudomonadota bacterium]